jgi:hypothetical protein
MKKIFEISAGIILFFLLIANYSDKTNQADLLIWYILTPNVLKIIVWLLLFFISGRLIFGRYNDYSNYFYKLLVDIFGEPHKNKKSK